MVEVKDLSRDVKKKLDAAGLDINQAIIKLVIESEHELIREYLLNGDTISIEGAFTASIKKRGYRDMTENTTKYTSKVEANIDWELKKEANFRNGLV